MRIEEGSFLNFRGLRILLTLVVLRFKVKSVYYLSYHFLNDTSSSCASHLQDPQLMESLDHV